MKTGIKTMTFAIVHFSVTLTVGWLITGSFVMGSMLAIIEPAVNTVAYAIHEAVWSRKQTTAQMTTETLSMSA